MNYSLTSRKGIFLLSFLLGSFQLFSQEQKFFLEYLQVDKNIDFHLNYPDPKSLYAQKESDENQKMYSPWFNHKNLRTALVDYIEDKDEWIVQDSIDTNSLFIKVKLKTIETCKSENKYKYFCLFRSIVDFSISDYQNNILLKEKDFEIIDTVVTTPYQFYSRKIEYLLPKESREEIGEAIIEKIVEEATGLKPKTNTQKEVISINNRNKNVSGKIEKHSIALRSKKFTISGVLLPNGYILTDYRMFRKPGKQVYMHTSQSDTVEVELIRSDKLSNVALAKIKGNNIPEVAPVKLASNYQLLDEVTSFGAPGGLNYFNTLSRGSVAGKTEEKNIHYFLIDSPSHLAYTGAGVFNKKGELMGIRLQKSYDDNINLIMPCIDIQQIENILGVKF